MGGPQHDMKTMYMCFLWVFGSERVVVGQRVLVRGRILRSRSIFLSCPHKENNLINIVNLKSRNAVKVLWGLGLRIRDYT